MFNLTNTAKIVVPALALLATVVSFSSHASVTPDRTRLVFNESDKCNQVNHLIPTRVLVKGGEITCKILK